jgi:D-alanyl-D-alanine carboxypeptidase.
MASRSLTDLHPDCRTRVEQWLAACETRGIDILVYCTYRSAYEQDELYKLGRSKPGRIVTMAHAGESWHNYRRAVDAVPLIAGKPDWTYSLHERHWQVFVDEAERVGLEWAGRWTGKFVEYVHLQYTGGMSLADAKALDRN